MSDPVPGSVMPSAHTVSPLDDAGQVPPLLRVGAVAGEPGRGHVGVDQHAERHAARAAARHLLAQHHAREEVAARRRRTRRELEAEQAQLAQPPPELARDPPRLLPGVRRWGATSFSTKARTVRRSISCSSVNVGSDMVSAAVTARSRHPHVAFHEPARGPVDGHALGPGSPRPAAPPRARSAARPTGAPSRMSPTAAAARALAAPRCRRSARPPPGTWPRSARRRGGQLPMEMRAADHVGLRRRRRRPPSSAMNAGGRRHHRDLGRGRAARDAHGLAAAPRGWPRAARTSAAVGVHGLRRLGAGEAEIRGADEDHGVRGVHQRGLDARDDVARAAGGQEPPGAGAARVDEVERDARAEAGHAGQLEVARAPRPRRPPPGTRATMIFLRVGVVDPHRPSRRSRGGHEAPRRWRRARPPRSSCRSCPCSPPTAGVTSTWRERVVHVGVRVAWAAPMMTAFESDEIPPPRPSSWRPYGSGLPSAASRIASRSRPAAGRSRSWKTRQRLVPPRMYTAPDSPLGHGCRSALRSAVCGEAGRRPAGCPARAAVSTQRAAKRAAGAPVRSPRRRARGERAAQVRRGGAGRRARWRRSRPGRRTRAADAPVDQVGAVDAREALGQHARAPRGAAARAPPPRARSPGRRSRRPR